MITLYNFHYCFLLTIFYEFKCSLTYITVFMALSFTVLQRNFDLLSRFIGQMMIFFSFFCFPLITLIWTASIYIAV